MSFWQRLGVPGLILLALLHVTDGAAQPVPVMGYVAAKDANPKRLEVFKQGLAELGYVEGRNLRIEYRWGAGDLDRFRRYAAELVAPCSSCSI